MAYSCDTDQSGVLESKFSVPRFDPRKHLRRDLASLGLSRHGEGLPKFIFLEGQAGQGKSTLAAQILWQHSAKFCWYRMEEADQSAAYFLGSLITGLNAAIPGFSTPAEMSIRSGEIPSEHVSALLTTILENFGCKLESEFILVLDNVHLGVPQAENNPLLRILLEHAPCLLHVVFIGRRNLTPLFEIARRQGTAVLLDAQAQAFTANEIATLFNTLFQVPLTRHSVKELRQLTDGWITGLQLAARRLRGQEAGGVEREIENLRRKSAGTFNYLLTQVLTELPVEQREALQILSLLEDIPVDLAALMTGCKEIGQVLEELSRDNFFIGPLDEKKELFSLHPLFRGELRQLMQREKTTEELARLYRLAANWFLPDQPDLAIRYLLAAHDYPAAEKTLRLACFHFPSQHRLTALRVQLGDLSGEILGAYPWFSYYCAIGFMSAAPYKALPLLRTAHAQFIDQGDRLGELLTGVQLMLYRVAVDGNYAHGYPLLERSMALLEDFADSLPPIVLGHVTNIALLANTFLRYDPALASRFFEDGLRIALREKLVTLEIEARVARLYFLIFSGDWQCCRKELEAALPLLRDPLCGQLHQGAMFLAYMGFLKGSGDFEAYARHKQLFRAQFAATLREGSVAEAYLLFWDMQLYCARGERNLAEAALRRAEKAQGAAAEPHMKNLFLQYGALLAAQDGRQGDALAAIDAARVLRKTAGGLYYDDLNDAFYGAAYDLLGEDNQALACFERAVSSPSSYLRETALAFRARYYHHRNDRRAEADLQALLGSMRAAGHIHFYGWFPDLMAELLPVAVRSGIEVEFARHLAEQRLRVALLDDGSSLPLLEILSFGGMQFRIGDRVVLSEPELSESQRELLAVLISQPSQSCSQKRLQLLFWPDSDESKSRNNFDKLLSRLRKSFETAIGSGARHYLQLKNGMLSLNYCRVDAARFLSWARQGKDCFFQGEHWSAENLLYKAIALYRGAFLADTPDNDLIAEHRVELQDTFLSSALVYVEILLWLRRSEEAIALLERSLTIDSLHDETVKKYYALLIAQDSPSRAQMVIKQYAEAMQREGYRPQEIRETLEAFWA